jgi:hypothetical protein
MSTFVAIRISLSTSLQSYFESCMIFVLLALGNFVDRSVPPRICGLFGTFVGILQLSSFSAVRCISRYCFQWKRFQSLSIPRLALGLSRILTMVILRSLTLIRLVFFFPTLVKLASPDVNDPQQLDLLFPLHSIADFVVEQLRPTDLNTEIFSMSRFNDAIHAWQIHLQELAIEHPPHARRFGRLARLLRERNALFRLAKMYSSALLQG